MRNAEVTTQEQVSFESSQSSRMRCELMNLYFDLGRAQGKLAAKDEIIRAKDKLIAVLEGTIHQVLTAMPVAPCTSLSAASTEAPDVLRGSGAIPAASWTMPSNEDESTTTGGGHHIQG